MHPLDQIVADLVGELLRPEEALHRRLLLAGQQVDTLPGRGVLQVVQQGPGPVLHQSVKLLVDLLEDRHARAAEVFLLGAEVAVRADGRGVQVVLDQRVARLELRQTGLEVGQAGVR